MRGHIRRRGETWSVVVDLPRGPDGKRRRKWHTVKGGRRDAERYLTKLLHQIDDGRYPTIGPPTIAAFTTRWLDAVASSVRDTTHDAYAQKIGMFVSYAGNIRIDRLDPATIAGVLAEIRKRGAAPRTVRHVHTVTRRMLRDAVRWQVIPSNPAAHVDPPHVPHQAPKVWNADQLRSFLAAAADDWLAPAWRLFATTGARRGEIAGLLWGDLEPPRLRIVRSAKMVAGRRVVDDVKTGRSRRALTLDEVTLDQLGEYRAAALARREPLGGDPAPMFAWDDGRPVSPDYLTRRFTKIRQAVELPDIPLHGLRHSYATLALTAGVHPKVVSERLGHASVTITLDTYSSVLPEIDAGAAATIAALLDL
ncbi:tyrosine-type recombinase/integrase [bacterium]|nr:tyrosine-type recombinase/integrase [bacterium]